MKIRITGELSELEIIATILKEKPFIRSISKPYMNRGSNDSRLYIESYELEERFLKELLERL